MTDKEARYGFKLKRGKSKLNGKELRSKSGQGIKGRKVKIKGSFQTKVKIKEGLLEEVNPPLN
ncbi:hypothetical protein SESBI_40627 [Sesbania bispinosa]|nr:hypothetical protein SESBI_40627 [Sesbania bispinosa]